MVQGGVYCMKLPLAAVGHIVQTIQLAEQHSKNRFDGRGAWMTVLELPYKDHNWRREYHASYANVSNPRPI